MKAIANTTVLSNFGRVGRIDLLRAVLGNLYIPTEVYAEIQVGIEEGYLFLSQVEAAIFPPFVDGWIILIAPEGGAEFDLFGQLSEKLHPGEAICMAIAKQRGWLLLTDDQAARTLATELGVELSGTLGVLVQAVRSRLLALDEANALLGQMIANGYRSPFATIDALLE